MGRTGRDAAEVVERAVRRLPRDERERYAEEWRHDVRAAGDPALAWEVAHGARRMAWRLRWRWVGVALLGQRGARALLTSWGGVVVLLVATALVPLPLAVLLPPLALALIVRALLDAGAGGRVVKGVAVGSLVAGVAAFGYLWWAWGVGFDAADADLPIPPAADHLGLALVVILLAVASFVVATVVGLRKAVFSRP